LKVFLHNEENDEKNYYCCKQVELARQFRCDPVTLLRKYKYALTFWFIIKFSDFY